MPIENVSEIKDFLAQNKDTAEVKTFTNELIKGGFNDFRESETGQKFLQPTFDSAISKAVNSFKEKTLPEKEAQLRATLESEFEQKYNPPKSPLEEEVRQLKLEMAEERRAKQLLESRGKIADLLPNSKFLDTLKLSGDVEADTALATNFKDLFDAQVQSAVDERLKGAGRVPGSGGAPAGEMTLEAFTKLSKEDQFSHLRSDKDALAKMKKQL